MAYLPSLSELGIQPGGNVLRSMRAIQDFSRQQEANKLLQLQNQFYEPMQKAELEQRQASTNRLNQLLPYEIESKKLQSENPLLSSTGAAGQIGAMIKLASNPGMAEKYGLNVNELNNLIKQSLQQNIASQQGRTELNLKRAQGLEFNSLPAEYKTQILALGGGMGIDPDTMTKELMSGKSLEQIASEKGYNPSDLPSPIYPLTAAGREQIRRRNDALQEINTLGKKVNEAMAPYSKRIAGYSPKQVMEALKGTNEDSQARFIAARALQPELAAIRLRMAGGNVGIEAIRELTNTSLGHVKIYEPFMNEKVFSKAMEYVDDWLNEAAQAANKQSLRTKASPKSNEKKTINNRFQ